MGGFRIHRYTPFDALRMVRLWLNPGRSEERTIFVVGSPRSGTTLLQAILTRHSAICSTECETGILTYQNIYDLDRSVAGVPLSALCIGSRAPRDIVEVFDSFSRTIRARTGKPIFLEKTPQHILYLRFILRHFPRAQIIHIHRDGRDCYCSARASKIIPQASSVERFATYWRACIRRRLHEGASDRILDVRYEDLAADAEGTLLQVMGFLALSPEPEQLDPVSRASDSRANSKPFQKLGKEIDSSSVGRWRSELDASAAAAFSKVAGAELAALSYD